MDTVAKQSKEEIACEISRIYEEMAEGTLNWNDEKARSLWTEDGLNMPDYGLTQNREELIEFCKDIALKNKWVILDYKPLELFVHGDMAYEFSLFEHNTTPCDSGKTVNTKMRCISVYKMENGRWKLHRWMPQYFTGE